MSYASRINGLGDIGLLREMLWLGVRLASASTSAFRYFNCMLPGF